MAYVEHEWVNGETITAEKMNNIEEGIVEASQSGGGGYDAEVSIYHDNNSASDYICTIISGTFAELKAKMENNTTPNVLFRIWDELSAIFAATTNSVCYSWNFNVSEPYIIFHIYPIISENSGNARTRSYTYFFWNAEDEVYFD